MNTFNKLVAASLGGSGPQDAGLTGLKSSVDEKYSAGASNSELAQWLSVAASLSKADLPSINTMLHTKTFLCSSGQLTVADAALCLAIATCKFQEAVKAHSAVMRYAVYIQSLLKKQAGVIDIEFYTTAPPIPVGTGLSAASPAADKKKEKEGAAAAPAAPAAVAAPATHAKGVKAEKPAKAATEVELEPSLLDIRVGVITKCWNHADSEKLLCEEVDCGEAAPRNIASGIRAFYSAEEFVGKRVMVLANLKARAIAGFPSAGMVLCACNADHSKVAILEPPADAKPGDKVEYAGFEGKEPAAPNAVAKKKYLEKLAPGLKTDAKGVAFSGKHQFLVNGKACTSVMAGAAIS